MYRLKFLFDNSKLCRIKSCGIRARRYKKYHTCTRRRYKHPAKWKGKYRLHASSKPRRISTLQAIQNRKGLRNAFKTGIIIRYV